MITDLNSIPVFVAVVESGNFAKAAQKLYVTRSAVGKTISRLEEQLGTTLFKRTTRSQILTEEGETLYQQSRLALDRLREAEEEIHRGKKAIKGRLRLSLPVLFGHRCVTPLLFNLTRRYPQLQLEVSYNDRQVNLSEEGFDLAVRIGDLTDSSFIKARQLSQHGMMICASSVYLKNRPMPLTVAELSDHPAIGYARGGILQSWKLQDEKGRSVDFNPTPVFSTDDFAAIAAAVSNGLGVAWLPDWLVSREIKRGEMLEILPGSANTTFQISAVWPAVTWMPQKTRVVIDELRSELPGLISSSI
ncbi:LysR family transcriptional regulator [bacteria symbiont BFo1 of Frankliniella occidentalis]|nr:LysR family transcriptional regulator [bacteria symbiont BFo1 of Frankliniella occidentalis]KYP82246.1 LysR family transcriptional regulator [bacteria symbiont BFo1 of Frankliniella occidentalis]